MGDPNGFLLGRQILILWPPMAENGGQTVPFNTKYFPMARLSSLAFGFCNLRLVCPICKEELFANILGLKNHCRIRHGLELYTREACIAKCGIPVVCSSQFHPPPPSRICQRCLLRSLKRDNGSLLQICNWRKSPQWIMEKQVN